MVSLYLKPLAAVIVYLFIFGLAGLVGHIQKNNDVLEVGKNSTLVNASNTPQVNNNNNNILKGVLRSCVSILCISFCFACYLIYKHFSHQFHSFIQKIHGVNPYYRGISPDKLPSTADEPQEISITISGAWRHQHLFALWLSIFCASYAIDATNLNAGFFFSISSGLVSCFCFFFKQYIKNETTSWLKTLNGLFTGCIFLIYVICFATWSFSFFLQHNDHLEVLLNPRYMWFEIIFPSFAPVIISFMKGKSPQPSSKKKPIYNGGFNHLLVALPFLTFTSMLIVTVYLTFASTNINEILTIENFNFPLFFTLYFIAAPLALCMALVIYISAMGQTKYCMISSSSLCLVFFLHSNWVLPVEMKNVILPCCIMCLIGVLLSLAILILNMYYYFKDSQNLDSDTTEKVELTTKNENGEDVYGCQYYNGDNDEV